MPRFDVLSIDLPIKSLATQQLCSASGKPILLEQYPQTDYLEALQAMQMFSNERASDELDRIWLIEHPATYTQGTACQQQTLFPSSIPVVKTDRGGQITYHGPGQIVLYPLLHLRRFKIGVKGLVAALEQAVINVLRDFQVDAERRVDAPGVYVDGAKIAALGLRIRRGNSYHGLSFNIDMDLSPFRNIDPCGYQGLEVTQLKNLSDQELHRADLAQHLAREFVSLI